MTRRLYLLRHAKSRWDAPDLDDHARPLAPRGDRAAAAMAAVVGALAPPPALVLCSSATRARQTLAGVSPGLATLPTRIEPALYTFEVGALLAFLRGLDEALETVLAIGHNPALEQAAHLLAPDGDAAALERLRGTYPTAALATVDARDDGPRWADLGPGWGRLTAFTRPCDLTAPS